MVDVRMNLLVKTVISLLRFLIIVLIKYLINFFFQNLRIFHVYDQKIKFPATPVACS